MSELSFTATHEWLRIDEDVATFGITDYAQKELGDIVFVELPELGDRFARAEQCVTIESTKAASEIFAPLSGEVLEVNGELVNNPQAVNKDPFGSGWMVKIKIEDKVINTSGNKPVEIMEVYKKDR